MGLRDHDHRAASRFFPLRGHNHPEGIEQVRVIRTKLLLALLAGVAIAIGLFCFSGYAMNASFSVAAEDRQYARAAARFGIAGMVSLVAAVGFGIAAWRHGRVRR